MVAQEFAQNENEGQEGGKYDEIHRNAFLGTRPVSHAFKANVQSLRETIWLMGCSERCGNQVKAYAQYYNSPQKPEKNIHSSMPYYATSHDGQRIQK